VHEHVPAAKSLGLTEAGARVNQHREERPPLARALGLETGQLLARQPADAATRLSLAPEANPLHRVTFHVPHVGEERAQRRQVTVHGSDGYALVWPLDSPATTAALRPRPGAPGLEQESLGEVRQRGVTALRQHLEEALPTHSVARDGAWRIPTFGQRAHSGR